jgi:hypothetical protein
MAVDLDAQNLTLRVNPAGGMAFALLLGCPILDDFQGWGFRAAFWVTELAEPSAVNLGA